MSDFDPDLDLHESQTPQVLEELDPVKVQHYVDLCRTRQNLPMAIVVGALGSLVSAGLWVMMSVTTGVQVAWMAICVGVIVGLTVRWVGRGIDMSFGITGAWLALLGCLTGDLLVGAWDVAAQLDDTTFGQLLANLTPELIAKIYRDVLRPLNVIYYVVAVAAAYKFAVRKIGREELVAYVLDDSSNDARLAA